MNRRRVCHPAMRTRCWRPCAPSMRGGSRFSWWSKTSLKPCRFRTMSLCWRRARFRAHGQRPIFSAIRRSSASFSVDESAASLRTRRAGAGMPQALLNGLVSGLLIALPAIALSLTYGVLNFANFSIGAMITTGAYFAYLLNVGFGASILIAAPLAGLGLALVAVAIQRSVYRWVGSDHITLLVASMGVAFVLENTMRFIYGSDVRTLDVPVARPVQFYGLRLNHEQLTIAIVSLLSMAVVAIILKRTRLGRAMRAISDDAALADVRGIDRQRTVDWTWVIAGILSAFAGVLIGLDGTVEPLMGANYLISVFAAAIVGGIGNPFGAVAGAILIGLIEETSALAVSTSYRQGVSFLILVLVLLLRPQGMFGVARITR